MIQSSRTVQSAIVALCAVFAANRAVAHTWEDPWFDQAARKASLVALAYVEADDGSESTVRLARVFVGAQRAGDVVKIWHGNELREHADSSYAVVGETQLFIVRADESGVGLTTFSDSYWAFAADDSKVYVHLRDPFARCGVPIEAFGKLLRFLRAKRPEPRAVRAFVDSLVEKARVTRPGTKDSSDVERQFLAMEVLYYFGNESYVDAVLPFFESPYYQIRVSCARALSGCGCERAVAALAERLRHESVAAVQSTICTALERIAERLTPEKIPKELLDFVAGALPQRIELAENLMDGRSNTLPAPRTAAIVAVMRMDCLPGTWESLAERAEGYWTKRAR